MKHGTILHQTLLSIAITIDSPKIKQSWFQILYVDHKVFNCIFLKVVDIQKFQQTIELFMKALPIK